MLLLLSGGDAVEVPEIITGGHDGSKDDWPDEAEVIAIIIAALRAGLII